MTPALEVLSERYRAIGSIVVTGRGRAASAADRIENVRSSASRWL
jgi:hypothetical protein